MNGATPSRRQLLRQLQQRGWRLDYQRKHIVAYHPDGVGVVTISRSRVSQRTWRNLLAQVRRVERGGYRC